VALSLDPGPVDGSEPLEWLASQLTFGPSVRSWVPDTFERYARILHPVYSWEETETGVTEVLVKWADVSAWSGHLLRPSSSFDDVERRSDGSRWGTQRPGSGGPVVGQLPRSMMERLTDLLGAATSTPERLWLLFWSGGAEPRAAGTTLQSRYRRSGRRSRPTRWLGRFRNAPAADLGPELELSPSLSASGRRYLLYRGSLVRSSTADHEEPDIEPNFWWPTDHAWLVSTDIDCHSTYVGGSTALVERLLGDDVLEVLPAALDDPYDGHGAR
jgi:hypothetical protein